MILAFALGITAMSQLAAGVQTQAELAEEMVRVHVVASENTPEAQAMKGRVKMAIQERLESLQAGTYNKMQMRLRIRENLAGLQQIARTVSGVPVTISFGVESFPTRYTEGQIVPAGKYDTLRIVLGPGDGHNWWCMLFPEYGESSWEEEQGEEVKFRFWLVELWQKWTSKWFEN